MHKQTLDERLEEVMDKTIAGIISGVEMFHFHLTHLSSSPRSFVAHFQPKDALYYGIKGAAWAGTSYVYYELARNGYALALIVPLFTNTYDITPLSGSHRKW